jgi:hypothetical protein
MGAAVCRAMPRQKLLHVLFAYVYCGRGKLPRFSTEIKSAAAKVAC